LGRLRFVVSLFAVSRLALAQVPDIGRSEDYLGQVGAVGFTVHDANGPRNCNEVSFAPIPGDPAHVLGRYNNGCANTSFSLARYAIDWNAHTLTVTNLAFDTGGGNVPICGPNGAYGGNSVSTAYDASVMSFNGEVWAAWECGGNLAGTATASTCVGPLNVATGVIDPTRTNVPVLGNNSINDGYLYSASVPELLFFQGNAYVYWSAVKINASNTSQWVGITGRGMRLAESPPSGGLLWSSQIGVGVGSYDPNYTTEVWGLGADAQTDNAVADIQGVFTDGSTIYVTAGVAGTACANPYWPPSCYQLALSKATNPLGTDVFSNGTQLSPTELTSNTHSYTRFFQGGNGAAFLLGGYYTNNPGPRPLPASGPGNAAYLWAYPIPSDAPFFYGAPNPIGGPIGVNDDGRLEAFAVDANSQQLEHVWQTTAGGPWRTAWAVLQGPSVGQTAAVGDGTGNLNALVRATDGEVHEIAQTGPGGAFGAWSALAPVIGGAGSPTVGVNADGRLEFFVVGADSNVYHAWQPTPGGALGNNTSMGSPTPGAVGTPAVATNADGRLEVFARGGDGAIWHSYQGSPGGGWSVWASLGGGLVGDPGVERNVNGSLEVFAVGGDQALWHTWQTSLSASGWASWSSLGGSISGRIAAAENLDGRLEVFARGTDGAIHHQWQVAPAFGWSGDAMLGSPNNAPGMGSPAVQANWSGALELFFVGDDSQLWHSVQTAPGAGWSNWSALGGSVEPFYVDGTVTSPPAPDAGADGGATFPTDGGPTLSDSGFSPPAPDGGADAAPTQPADAGSEDGSADASQGGMSSSCGCATSGAWPEAMSIFVVCAVGLRRAKRSRARTVIGRPR
jgi:hypothetical protein